MADVLGVLGNVGKSTLGAASIAASYALQDAQQRLIDRWLSTNVNSVGFMAHILAGLTTESLSIIQAPLQGPRSKANNLGGLYKEILNVPPEVAEFANQVNSLFKQPNIEGIVIFAESEQTDRTMEVSESPMVVQQDLAATTYITDNAVPKPRTWTLQGHLTTVLQTDHYFVIKPSLLLQRNYLDNCMKSRKPVVFKTYDNQFVNVLIANMKTAWDPKSMNTMSISVTLKEYVPITVTESPLTAEVAKKIGVTYA